MILSAQACMCYSAATFAAIYTNKWEDRTAHAKEVLREDIKIALLAALDVDDVALREALLPFMEGDTAIDASENARAAIAALRALAQDARGMIEFRFVVPEETSVPPPIPRLQWRTRLAQNNWGDVRVGELWSPWEDVPTVALTRSTERPDP